MFYVPMSDRIEKMKRAFAHDPLLMGKTLLPDSFNRPSAKFHEEIIRDYIDGSYKKHCYIAPRGHAKSTIVGCLLVLHHLKFARQRQKFVMLVSKTEGHSIALLDTIKNILSGDAEQGLYARFFGAVNRKNARRWGTRSIELPDRSVIVAKGTGQQVVGSKKDSQRPTFIVVDDPEDLNNTKTRDRMEDNQNWLLRQVVPSLDPEGMITVIGTPQNELCIVETLHRMQGEWRCRRWSALNGDGWEQDTKKATALWPEWKDVKTLYAFYKDCEAIGRTSYFYMEYQCVVQGDGDRKFNSNMFRYFRGEIIPRGPYKALHGHYYSSDGKKGQEFIYPVTVQVGIDLASSVSERNDWSVVFPWALTWTKNMYQMPYDRFREHPMQGAERIANYLRKLDPDYVFIESQNFQVMMRDTLREFYGLNYSGMGKKITYSDNKEDRMFNKLQPFYALGSVYHYHGSCKDLEDELLMFPRSRFDDTMDAGATGLYRVMWPSTGSLPDQGTESQVELHDEIEDEDNWMTA